MPYGAGLALHADTPNAANAAKMSSSTCLKEVSCRLDCTSMPQYLGEKVALQGGQVLASQLTAVQPGAGCQAGGRLFQQGSHGFQDACLPAAPRPTYQQPTWCRCLGTSKLASAAQASSSRHKVAVLSVELKEQASIR